MRLVDIRVVEPPAVLPVSEEEFIDHARLNGLTVDRQPELINRELTAATLRGEQFCRRSFITQHLQAIFLWDAADPPETAGLILLPRGVVQAVDSVTFTGGAVADPNSYTVNLDWGTVQLTAIAGSTAGVKFISGYGDEGKDVPDLIREGILNYAAVLYEDRIGARETKYAATASGTLPRGIRDMWRPFQIEVSG